MSKRRRITRVVQEKRVSLRPQLVPLAADLARFCLYAEALDEPLLAAEAAARLEHLAGGDFSLVVLGRPGVGKATLVNALLGARVVPTNADATGDAAFAETEFSAAAGKTIVRLVRSGAELVFEHRGRWIAARANVAIFPLDSDGSMATPCLAALDCADAVLLVVDAEAPPSHEHWDRLGKTFVHMPQDRLLIAANKFDRIGPADRESLLAALAARAREAFPTAPPLYGMSANDALGSKQQFDAVGLAANGLGALEAALTRRLAPLSDVSRAAVNNEAVGRLGTRLRAVIRTRRSSIEAGSDTRTERLLRLQGDLDHVVEGVDQWFADIERRGRDAKSAIIKMKRNLADRMAKDVQPLVAAAPFSWRYIEEPAYRNRELQRACDPKLFAGYRAAATDVRREINEMLNAFAAEIDRLEAAWEAARSARLESNGPAPSTREIDQRSRELAVEIEFLLEAIINTSGNFETEFRRRCTVFSPRAFFLRCWRRLGQDVADTNPKFEEECIRALQGAARQAVEEARLEAACQSAVEVALQAIWSYAMSLAEAVHGELHEHKLALRQQYENAQAGLVREQEQLETTWRFCEALDGRVGERGNILAALGGATEASIS